MHDSTQARIDLSERLQAQRPEIEQAIRDRVHGVAGVSALDPEYAEGLRAAIAVAIDYGFAAVERGEERAPPVPAALLAQARVAARSGVNLDTVLRRYFAGYALLGDFLLGAAEDGLFSGNDLKRLLGAQAALFDRLLVAVAEEYTREAQSHTETTSQRRADRVKRLLAGELIGTSGFAYDFDAHHLAVIAFGVSAAQAIDGLAASLDRRLLTVRPDQGTVWAWFGGRHRVDSADLEQLASASRSPQVSLAIGEPGEGIGGWRLSHRQARAALPIAMRNPSSPCVRYADVVLLASMLQDDLLVTSLQSMYLARLADESDGGSVLRETLRAYFAADRNGASAAAALGVSRQTVSNRLHTVEERLERPLTSCGAEVEAALRLEELASLDARFAGPWSKWL